MVDGLHDLLVGIFFLYALYQHDELVFSIIYRALVVVGGYVVCKGL